MFGPNCLIFSIIELSMENTVVTTTAPNPPIPTQEMRQMRLSIIHVWVSIILVSWE